jgi:hypothetical protein
MKGVEEDVQIIPRIARCTLRELITQTGRFHGLNEILHDERYEWDCISELRGNARLMATKFGSMIEWYIKSNSEDNAESLTDKCAFCKTLNGQSVKRSMNGMPKSATLPLE